MAEPILELAGLETSYGLSQVLFARGGIDGLLRLADPQVKVSA